MAYGLMKKAARHIIRHPKLYGTLAGLAVGLGVAAGTYQVADNIFVRPKAAEVEFKNRVGDVFGEMAYKYYNPSITRGDNVLFYNQPPGDILSRLQETKTVIDKNREFLSETGYLKDLYEPWLNTAINNVQSFTTDWPQNAPAWYAYLYAGDSARPSRTYAAELMSFYGSAEAMRKNLKDTDTGEPWRNGLSSVTGVIGAVILWSVYKSAINGSIDLLYKRMISEEEHAARMRKLGEFSS